MSRLNAIEDANQRGAMEALIKQPGCSQIRKLSPREVYTAGKHTLTKLSPFILNTIIPSNLAQTVTVTRKHEIVIKDREIDPEPLRYLSRVKTANNRTELIAPGTELKLYLNPFNPDLILVCDQNHAAIGLADRLQASCRLDEEGVLRQIGKVAQVRNELSLDARERDEGLATHRQALKEHNRRIIDGEPTDESERRSIAGKKAADTRHTNKVKQYASTIDTDDTLDAWATPQPTHQEPEPEEPQDDEPFPFST